MDVGELRQALEAILASNEEPPPSIREVALRLGYRSETSLYDRFPELTHKIVAKHRKYTSHYKERTGSSELQQALEMILASQEEPPLSVPEAAQRLGYRSERSLYKRFPDLSRAIAERYQQYKFNRQESMNLEELRQALEATVASEEEPFPSMNEVAQFLGYRSPTFLYKHFPELSHAITIKKRRSENLLQKLEILLKDAAPTITQQEIAKHLGCSIQKLHHHFPALSSILEQRFIQSFDLEALQAALEKELAPENEARSLSAVAESLGYPVRTLTKFFPSLCQKIIVRGQLHRKKHNELRKQKIQEEVQRVVFTIDAEQQYPSLNQMLKRIDQSCVNPPIYYLEAYAPWRKALESLGY